MSGMVPAARFARQRAGQIRQGMRDYLKTLALIKEAWDERDWLALGYESWQSYVDGEFGAERLGLTPAHRRKAVEELRLAGMSQRAIGATLGVSQETVRRDLSGGDTFVSPEAITGVDGKAYAATKTPDPNGAGTAAPAAASAPVKREVDAGASGAGAGRPESQPVEHAEGDARRDAELDAEMADTAVRFRRNFSAAMAAAAKVWSFDAARIAEVYTADWDTDIQRGFIDEMRRWCDRAEEARRARPGLRVVNGGRK